MELFPNRTGKAWSKVTCDRMTDKTVAMKKDLEIWANLLVVVWSKHEEVGGEGY